MPRTLDQSSTDREDLQPIAGTQAGKRTRTESVALQRRAAAGSSPGHALPPAVESGDDPFGLHLSPRPVQAEGGLDAEPAAVHEAAQRGLSAPSTALPHRDQIQASFGPAHDLSGVEAHVGGAAAEASAAMGASAYATGHHVAFAAAPDLHTAAHEAAHTVQQRQGVQLRGGVGEVGDPYERHADDVADRVVRGESAADLLEGLGGGGGVAVQRVAHVGWAGAAGSNAAEVTIGADGHRAAAGVRRVPLEGLATVAREHGQGRAIVLIPPSVQRAAPGAAIDALVHLHGNGARRYDDHGPVPMDIGVYQLEQQLMASHQMIGILPQSNNPGRDGVFGPGNVFHPGDLVAEVFEFLRQQTPPALPEGATRGQVTLSAHSGGGTEMRRQMARELAAGGDASAPLPPDAVNHVMLFDCINSSAPGHHGDETDGFVAANGIFTRWVIHRLERDLARLQALAEPERRAYLATSTRLIGTSSNDSDPTDRGAYPRRCRKLQQHIDAWFAAQDAALTGRGAPGAPTVGDLWRANYEATLRSGGEHVGVLAHRDRDGHGNFERALGHLPGQRAPGAQATAQPAAVDAAGHPVAPETPRDGGVGGTTASGTTASGTTATSDAGASGTTTTTGASDAGTTATTTTTGASDAGTTATTATTATETATTIATTTPRGGSSDQAAPFAAERMTARAGSPEEVEFVRAVYQAQLGRYNRRNFHPSVDAAELASVEGVRVRDVIVADLTALLAAARADLAADQADAAAANHRTAAQTTTLGVHNGYRGMSTERIAWMDTMHSHLRRSAEHRATLADGPFGPTARREAVSFMFGAKTVPGFSNHSQGLAVDFKTTFRGHALGPTTDQRPTWRQAWLYQWLRHNAGRFNFHPISTEEWHYDHREGAAGAPSRDHDHDH